MHVLDTSNKEEFPLLIAHMLKLFGIYLPTGKHLIVFASIKRLMYIVSLNLKGIVTKVEKNKHSKIYIKKVP